MQKQRAVRVRRDAAEWARILKRLETSKMTQARFCRAWSLPHFLVRQAISPVDAACRTEKSQSEISIRVRPARSAVVHAAAYVSKFPVDCLPMLVHSGGSLADSES